MNIINIARTVAYTDPYGDDWKARFVEQGLPTALLGILTVFAVLALIWGSLEIFRYVFYTIPENKKNEGKAPAQKAEKPASAPAAAPAPAVQAAPSAQNNDELIAAIIAAVTAARAEAGEVAPGAFRVVSFRRR